MGWIWIALLAGAVAVLVAAEWPRLSGRFGWEGRRVRARKRQKAQFTLLDGPLKDTRGEFLTDAAGKVRWMRVGGRVYKPTAH